MKRDISNINQCDGCRIKAPFNSWGHHVYPNNGGLMGCTKHLYEKPEDATLFKSENLNKEKNGDQ